MSLNVIVLLVMILVGLANYFRPRKANFDPEQLPLRTERNKSRTVVKAFERSKRMLRVEILQFLELDEIKKLAMTCKQMNKLIDPKNEKTNHFKQILLTQIYNNEIMNLKRAVLVEDCDGVFDEDQLYMKDLGKYAEIMVHELGYKNGFLYRRYNSKLKGMEYLGYAGNTCAHSDNPQYFERKLMPNSQFGREAMWMKAVCWLHMYAQIDRIPFDSRRPYYDVYLFHGNMRQRRLNDQVELKISVSTLDSEEWQQVKHEFFKHVCSQNVDLKPGKVMRTFLGRIDVGNVFPATQNHFKLKLEIDGTQDGRWKQDYVLEGIMAINISDPYVQESLLQTVELKKPLKIIDTQFLLKKDISSDKRFLVRSCKNFNGDSKYLTINNATSPQLAYRRADMQGQVWKYLNKNLVNESDENQALNLPPTHYQERQLIQLQNFQGDADDPFVLVDKQIIHKKSKLYLAVLDEKTNCRDDFGGFNRDVIVWARDYQSSGQNWEIEFL